MEPKELVWERDPVTGISTCQLWLHVTDGVQSASESAKADAITAMLSDVRETLLNASWVSKVKS